jgi:hypothetical protein
VISKILRYTIQIKKDARDKILDTYSSAFITLKEKFKLSVLALDENR